MNSIIFQLIFLVFSLLVIASIWKKTQKGEVTVRGAVWWTLFWIFADVAVLWPDMTTRIANRFGIGRGSDFVLYIALALMFFFLFRFQIKLERMNRDITNVVRREALDKDTQV